MEQIVYVVLDELDNNVMGVYNTLEAAEKALDDYNDRTVVISPVLVDAPVDLDRRGCRTEKDVLIRTQEEIQWARTLAEQDDEDEDEDDEDDRIRDMLYEKDGYLYISCYDAAALMREYMEQVKEEYPSWDYQQVYDEAGDRCIALAEEFGIDYVDMEPEE